jgi:signal transduction histidine kinase
MSLHAFLTRLIWLCVLPLALLAAYLAIHSVQTAKFERDLNAANLAKNFATAIDQELSARIDALHILAMSPLVDHPSRWRELYQEAQGFHHSFGSSVILADPQLRMLFSTRASFGEMLPDLPRPRGQSAALTALKTGKPAIGDTFFGPISRKTQVAIAVPAHRGGRTVFLLMTVIDAEEFQQRIDQLALPAGWALSLLDGNGEAIARRAPAGFRSVADTGPDAAGRFVVASALSRWSAVLEIPRDIYRAPVVSVALALAIALACAIVASVLGGLLASRRLGTEVASLAEVAMPDTLPPGIIEIAAVRHRLDEAAEALRELNASLEQRVAQRTAELTAANQELDSFAYAVSHDLRAPLRAMSGFSRALIEDYSDRLDGAAKDYLDQIDIATRKMGDLIDGILALCRSTRGSMQRNTIDLSALAGALVIELERADPERRVKFEIEPGLLVHGDVRMIECVMRNLLDNAWKYTARTPAPLIRVYAGELDGVRSICVADNGAGFDMAHAAQLFEPFRRLHRQDEFPGIGVGLATVQRIVYRHGGRIHASAVPGEGATFCFTLADDGGAATEDGNE